MNLHRTNSILLLAIAIIFFNGGAIELVGVAQAINPEDIKVDEFNSPSDFNHAISNDRDLSQAAISFYEEIINDDLRNIIFLDKEGNRLNSIEVSREKHQRVRFEDKMKEVLITTPKYVYVDTTGIVLGNEYYTTVVYDSTGQPKFSFKDETLTLQRLNKNFYISTPVSEMDFPPYCYIVDGSGQKIHKIENLGWPNVKAIKDDVSIVQNSFHELYVFDSEANIKWKKDMPLSGDYRKEINISRNGLICAFGKSRIYILDANTGEIQLEIPMKKYPDGIVNGKISDDGQHIFWINSMRIFAGTPMKNNIVLYDLKSHKNLWNLELPGDEEHHRVPKRISINEQGVLFGVQFYPEELTVFDRTGNMIFDASFSETYGRGELYFRFINDNLLIKDWKTNKVQLIKWGMQATPELKE